MEAFREGFNFRPKDDEIISYLLDKVTGCGSKSGCNYLIRTADLYGEEEPWEIFREFCGGDSQVFLFTKLKKVAAGDTKSTKSRGQRISRNVGQGFWCNKGQKDPIFGRKRGQITGHKRCFRYERKKKGGGGGGNEKWLLKEYTLPESLRVKEEYRDYALCLLKRKDDGGGRKNHHGPDVEIGFEEMLEAVLKKTRQQPAPQQPAAVPSCGGGGDEEEEDWVQMIDWGDFVCDVVEPGGEGNVPAAGGGDSVFGLDQEVPVAAAGGGGELQQGTRVSACGVEGLLGGGGVDDYFNLNRRLSGAPPVLL